MNRRYPLRSHARHSQRRSSGWLVGVLVVGALFATLGACGGTGPSSSPQGGDSGPLPPDLGLPHDASADGDAATDGSLDGATGSNDAAHDGGGGAEAGNDGGGDSAADAEEDAPSDAPRG
jgi:hypothetical protein